MSWSRYRGYSIYTSNVGTDKYSVYEAEENAHLKGDKPPRFLTRHESMAKAHYYIDKRRDLENAVIDSLEAPMGPSVLPIKCYVQPKAGLPFEARRLTTNNLEEVARWTGGQVKGTKLPLEDRIVEWYDQHFDGGMDIGARVGQWIIKWGSGFHVCSQEQFDANFIVTKVE